MSGQSQTALDGKQAWDRLNGDIMQCKRCPRLRDHCRDIAITKRRAYQSEEYWGRPVPNFGDPGARLLVIGLAPGAHGANRTGRMFTGDRSGDWLFRALAKAGFANRAESLGRDDGMELLDCAITNACHCAPPLNKPTAEEISHCRCWLDDLLAQMRPTVFLALGQLAWKQLVDLALHKEWLTGKRPKFSHCAEVPLAEGRTLIGSYHPSQQNTFTGRLTEEMFDAVFAQARKLAALQNSSSR